MIHLIWLLRRQVGLDQQAFLAYWHHVHAPLVERLPGVHRYVQNSTLPVRGERPPYDGVAEIWVKDEAAAAALLRCRAFREGALADERNFVDVEQVVRLQTVDHVVLSGGPVRRDDPLPKRMTFFKRKAGMTRDQLLCYWRGVHGPLAASAPGPRRYVQSAVLPSTYEQGEPRFDGVAQIWFDDGAALQTLVESKLFRESVKPDERNFVAADGFFTLATEERRVIWPEPA
jgi:uncharacterized protein (TIGR02118 family)